MHRRMRTNRHVHSIQHGNFGLRLPVHDFASVIEKPVKRWGQLARFLTGKTLRMSPGSLYQKRFFVMFSS